jgi:hypothetical protein
VQCALLPIFAALLTYGSNLKFFMTARDERARGVGILTDILTNGRILHLRPIRVLNDGFAYLFEVTAYEKLVTFCLPAEVLEDMEGTREYRNQANSFARALETRLRNPSPNSFMTKSASR